MKFLFGILLSTLLISCGSSYDLSTYENLGEEVFNAIKDNDIDRMIHFVPTRDEISEILTGTQNYNDEKVQKYFTKLDKEFGPGGNKVISQNIPEQFPRIRDRLLKSKDGSELTWDTANYKNSYLQYTIFGGYKIGEILVEVECNKELFYFTIEAAETPNKQWKIADDINVFRGDSESVKTFIDHQGLQERNNY